MGAAAAETMKQTPMYQAYARVAPRLDYWPVLLTKLGVLLKQDYDWSREVAGMVLPMLIVVGDADSVRLTHAVEMFGLRGGGKKDGGWDGAGMSPARLAILPGMTHYNIFSSPELAEVAVHFLDVPLPASSV